MFQLKLRLLVLFYQLIRFPHKVLVEVYQFQQLLGRKGHNLLFAALLNALLATTCQQIL